MTAAKAPKLNENASPSARTAASCAAALPPVHALGLGLPLADGTYALHAGQKALLDKADVLVGGKRVLEHFSGYAAQKLPVSGDLSVLYEQIAQNRAKGLIQVALCSGDPLFFGLGARLVEFLGKEAVRVLPALSSFQAAAALLGIAPESARAVSLHGKKDKWALAHALLAGGPVFVLTDAHSDPQSVAAWMDERGCGHYILHVLESLFLGPEGEVRVRQHTRLSVPEAAVTPISQAKGPVILALEPVQTSAPLAQARPWPFGLCDEALAKHNNLLTKAPVRATALAALGIEPHHVVWDLGGGSGAVGLEAARLAWQGALYTVEQHPDRLAIIHENRRRCGAANMEIIAGKMPDCLPDCLPDNEAGILPEAPALLPSLPAPDRIFLGGGLGTSLEQARDIIQRAYAALKPGGIMLADCVLLSSLERARHILGSLGAKVSITTVQASTSEALANDTRLLAHNPVFLVRAEKPLPDTPGHPHERTA